MAQSKDGALIQITLPYACGGVVLRKKKGLLYVSEAPPIFRWMIGKAWADIKHWIKLKRGSSVIVPYNSDGDGDVDLKDFAEWQRAE